MGRRRWARDPGTERLLDGYESYAIGVLGLQPGTLPSQRSELRRLAQWLREACHVDLTTLDRELLTAWLIAQAEEGRGARGRQGAIYVVRAFYDWLRPEGPNPAREISVPRTPPPIVDGYRPEDVARILDTAAVRTDLAGRFDYIVLVTLHSTGMRAGELSGLRRDQLDLATRRARVVGKGGYARTVPIPRHLAELLGGELAALRDRVAPATERVFANPRVPVTSSGFGRLDRDRLTRLCRAAGRAARIPGRHHAHPWRHTYATELVQAGVDLYVVQRLLGHRSLDTTVRYLHLRDADLRTAIDRTFPDVSAVAGHSA